MPDRPTEGLPRRFVTLIVLAALLPIIAMGVVLYTTFGGEDEQTFPVVQDYLREPTTVPERVAAISSEVRRIQISHGNIEVYDAQGQRYSIGADGQHLRRGGAVAVPARSFAVDEVDFGRLPAILAAAVERSGAQPTNATVEDIGGELGWRVIVWGEGGSNELLYTLDGELRLAANARP